MKPFRVLLLVLAAVLFSQCSEKEPKPVRPEYNEYVEAFTVGSVSRTGAVRVVFSQDVPQSVQDSLKSAGLLRLSPSAAGTCTWVDGRTLVFAPKEELKRNATYVATVAVDKIFAGSKEFKFSFQVKPFSVDGGLKSFDVTDDDQYKLVFNLTTADAEEGQVVESHITCNLESKLDWTHTADGLEHQLTVTVKPEEAVTLGLTQEADKGLACSERLVTISSLPSSKTFTVVSQRSLAGETKCIEVTFNKNLDPKQEVKGMVYITGKEVQAKRDGNKVMLYGNFAEGENVQVSVDKNLRSKSGQKIYISTIPSVVVNNFKPDVQFVGQGDIVPQGDRVLLPFRSVYMRGVRVLIYKIFSNRMGTVMSRCSKLSYMFEDFGFVARPVAVTTIYLDDKGTDLSEWHNYAIDMTKLFKVEPGAIYRVELHMDARLSAWPSDSLPKATRGEMEQADAALFEKVNGEMNECRYYWSTSYDDDGNYYDYFERQNPSCPGYYRKTETRYVLATNIGLTAMRGNDNCLAVTAINLLDAQPMADVKIEAYNLQEQHLANGQTDAQGNAMLHYSESKGVPVYLIARKDKDVSYLRVTTDDALSTSVFDVSGEEVQHGIKGYIYGERGVWRPGDTLHLAFMLNDRTQTLPDNHPVTLKVTNPLGQVTNRLTKTTGAMGIYSFNVPTAEDAPTGLWNAQITVGGVSFNKTLRIEAIKPNRLKIDLALPKQALSAGSTPLTLQTEWLNGNRASGLRYDVKATLTSTTTTWTAWKGFTFDDPTKHFETAETDVASGSVDAEGKATMQVKLNPKKDAPGMLAVNLSTRVYEPSGEFSVDGCRTLLAPYYTFVGVKAPVQTRRTHLDTDRDYTYEVVAVDKNGEVKTGVPIDVKVYKVGWYWWWRSNTSSMANFSTSEYRDHVETLSVRTDGEGKASFKLNIPQDDWGTYFIVASDAVGGHSAGVMSYYDWPSVMARNSSGGTDRVTSLAITTDKTEYAPGEKIHISVPSEEGSRAIVSLCNGSNILSVCTYECQKGNTEFVVEATDEMMPNAYITVSLVQRYNQTLNDMPIRMYGIVPITVNSADSHLQPQISCKDEFRPETKVQVTVSEKSGRPMGYTLAIVDEGLLDLTRFKTPNAWSRFNAREALGVRMWDLYSQVSGAFGGRIEQMFSVGGDEALNNGPKAIVNRFTPMVHFAGPFTLEKGKSRTHTIPVPNYNGRVRVMVVAGDGRAYGNAEKSVQVRKPLMMTGTMPRQIGRGDEVTVSATVFATEAMKDVVVKLSTSSDLQPVGEKEKHLSFAEAGDKTVQFRVRQSGATDVATVSLVAQGGSNKADYTTRVKVRNISQTVRRTETWQVDGGASVEKSLKAIASTDNQMLLDVSAVEPLNMMARLNELIGYPHGCVEQTISKAFPQLYLPEFTLLYEDKQKQIEDNVKNCITRLASFQTSDGGMSYWPGGSISHDWASAYVLHFLSEASARGYYVPEDMMRRLKLCVAAKANAWTPTVDAFTAAYQLYVLAAIRYQAQGAMNRMKEHSTELGPKSLYLLSASYALTGRKDVAQSLIDGYEAKVSDGCESWWVPESVARLIAQMAMGDVKAAETAHGIRQQLMSDGWMSTCSTAFSLFTMSQYYRQNSVGAGLQFRAQWAGNALADVKTDHYVWNSTISMTDSMTEGKLSLTNRQSTPIFVTCTLEGVANQSAVEAASEGLEVKVIYTGNDGHAMSVSKLSQSTTFKACVTVHNASGKELNNVALTHILPAGWEVLSATPAGQVSYQDLRDDRVYTYIDHMRMGESVTVTLSLSATYSGHYYMPSVYAEAMYDSTINGRTASSDCVVE